VQAITAVQDEFRLILVVTHIDELKERFERRIEVTRIMHADPSLAWCEAGGPARFAISPRLGEDRSSVAG
jgi:hypothetical protein